MQKIKVVTFLLLCFFFNYAAAGEAVIDSKNLSYAGARVEILPLLTLSLNNKNSDNIIFIHPPKVGGTNVVYVIDSFKHIKSKRFSVPRVKGRSPGLITNDWLGGLLDLKEQCVDSNKCDEYTFISGHFPYGAHKYLSSKKYTYITLIRNPIEREISSVNFDYQRGYITDIEQATKYLLDTMIDNPQTRMLAGEDYMSGPCSEKTLEAAIQNLNRNFLLIGVTEDTGTFIQALISILHLEPVAIGKSQVTYKKIFSDVPVEITDKLLNKHKYDIELYKYAKEKWDMWKREHIIGKIPVKTHQKILTIMPEYANTYTPVYMTDAEINEYNKSLVPDSLIKIEQRHHGLDSQGSKSNP